MKSQTASVSEHVRLFERPFLQRIENNVQFPTK